MAPRLVGALTEQRIRGPQGGRHQQGLVLGGAALLLIVIALFPLASPLLELGAAEADVAEILGGARTWALFVRSIALAGGVTALALGIGVPLGFLLARTDVLGGRLVALLHGFPMFVPPFLLALGWFHLLGREGLAGTQASAALLFSPWGVVCVLGLGFAPIATALTALGVLGVDDSLEEAARVVARPWRVATRVLLPAAWPAVALAGVVIFALALAELGVPMFLRVDVYPTAVFVRLGGVTYAPGEAFALALPLVVIAVGLVVIERRARGARSFAVLGLRGAARAPIALGRLRVAASAACWASALLAVAPIAALAWGAARGGGFRALPDWIGASPTQSLMMGAAAATAITVLGLILGHALARNVRGAAALDAIAVTTFLVPAPVLGVGLIAMWNRPSTQAIYGGLGILVLGAVARYAVIGVRTVAVTVAQSSPHLEEAAAVAGARFVRRLLRVVLPIHARGVFAGWLLAFVFVLRDLEMAVLFYPPGGAPLTVRIFTLEANGPPAVVAALAVLHVAMTAAALSAGGYLLRRRGPT